MDSLFKVDDDEDVMQILPHVKTVPALTVVAKSLAMTNVQQSDELAKLKQ